LEVPGQSLYTYIGAGLGGDIYGYIGRVKRFRIGDYNFKKPIATFPDEESVPVTEGEEDRGGSIGADIIKRFDVVIDYRGEEILLKPNEFYKDEFKYNLSGIDLTTPLPDVPLFQVAKIRKGSPAWIAGLEVGDQIVNINGIETSEYSLSNIVEMLQSRPGRTFRIGVRRIDETFYAKFTLEDPIK
jgi:membrane-associated protease RseP (regulator of RpoE activity)